MVTLVAYSCKFSCIHTIQLLCNHTPHQCECCVWSSPTRLGISQTSPIHSETSPPPILSVGVTVWQHITSPLHLNIAFLSENVPHFLFFGLVHTHSLFPSTLVWILRRLSIIITLIILPPPPPPLSLSCVQNLLLPAPLSLPCCLGTLWARTDGSACAPPGYTLTNKYRKQG